MLFRLTSLLLLTAAPLLATSTIPPSITASSAVSSLLATATLVPNDGNPASILSYPLCAQICTNETTALQRAIGTPVGNTSTLQTACSPTFRSLTAGCQAATCNSTDYATTQSLAAQLCNPLYATNATLSASVLAAIASATAAARGATEGKDASDVANLPACARKCLTQNAYNGCSSISNLVCICQGIAFNNAVGPCQTAACSAADLTSTILLAEKLCAPVGGILTHPVNFTGSTSGNTTTTGGTPSPLVFTGGAGRMGLGLGGLGGIGAMAMAMVAWVLLGLWGYW